jgi:recombinational DNA repair protein (RecF pathway)
MSSSHASSATGQESCSTVFLVLRTTQYRERDLILHGISPDFGKLTLLAYGAAGAAGKGKNNFPIAGLFRELAAEFRQIPNREIFPVQELELLSEYDNVASHPEHCRQLGQMANFLLQHLGEGLPVPLIYDAFLNLLKNAASPQAVWSVPVCSVLFKLVYLYENGLLPEGSTQEQNDFLENLVASGIDDSPLPQCPERYWNSLNNWMNSLLEFHHLER